MIGLAAQARISLTALAIPRLNDEEFAPHPLQGPDFRDTGLFPIGRLYRYHANIQYVMV